MNDDKTRSAHNMMEDERSLQKIWFFIYEWCLLEWEHLMKTDLCDIFLKFVQFYVFGASESMNDLRTFGPILK